MKTAGPFHIRRVAEHYGVYDDLFGDAYFIPRVMLDVRYKLTDDSYLPVHRGNVIKPSEVFTTVKLLEFIMCIVFQKYKNIHNVLDMGVDSVLR
jgi:hypothetical protein